MSLWIGRMALLFVLTGAITATGCGPATSSQATPTATGIPMPSSTPTLPASPTPPPTPSPTVAVPQEVPASFRGLYAELLTDLDEFESNLPAGPGQGTPIVAADLPVADSRRGPELLAQGAFLGIANYLPRLEALGAQGVSISLDYPLLAPATPRWREYLNLYELVVQQIRGRKLKLLISVGLTPTDPALSRWQPDYSAVTPETRVSGRRQQAQTIVRQLKPDYLTIANDPARESAAGGTAMGVTEFTALVNGILDGLDRGGVLVGACVSSTDDIAYAESLLENTTLDYLDLHMVALGSGAGSPVAKVADRVHRSGKRLVISESWLRKLGAEESDLAYSDVLARNAYSFWQPLDARFVAAAVRSGRVYSSEWVSLAPSWYLFGYVDHGSVPQGQSAGEILDRAVAEASKAAALNKVSETGAAYRAEVVGSR